MKPSVILLVYGSGGHRTQMVKLLDRIYNDTKDFEIKCIGISESQAAINHPLMVENFEQAPLRNKYFSLTNLLKVPKNYYDFILCFLDIRKKYKVKALISTGPGLAIPFSLLFKIEKAKIIFIETWSRFETQSYAGKVMYRLADKFYIQNKSQAKFYPKATYSGLL